MGYEAYYQKHRDDKFDPFELKPLNRPKGTKLTPPSELLEIHKGVPYQKKKPATAYNKARADLGKSYVSPNTPSLSNSLSSSLRSTGS